MQPLPHGSRDTIGSVTYFVVLVAVLLFGFAVAATTGRLGPGLEEPTSTQASFGLPDLPVGELPARAVEQVRLDQALRGYRMDQVDAVLDRLASELAERDAELARLRPSSAGGSSPSSGATAVGVGAVGESSRG